MIILGLSRLYATYLKEHIDGRIYVGRTSGWVTKISLPYAQRIIRRRDRSHHRNKDGFGPAKLDEFSNDKDAIYGREQAAYDALVEQGMCGNKIRPVGKNNKKLKRYMAAAAAAFGDITLALITWHFFVNPLF